MNVDFRECRAYGTPSFSAIPFDIELVYVFSSLNLIEFKFLIDSLFLVLALRAVLIFIMKRTVKSKVPVPSVSDTKLSRTIAPSSAESTPLKL